MGDALHTNGGVTDAREARLAQAGLIAVVGPSALDARTGVLHGPGSTALVTGTGSTAPMRYAVAPHQWVTSRGAANGPYLGSLEAQQLVDTTAAPPSGQSRIDVIWEKQQDATPGVPSPDATTAPQYGCTQGGATTGTPAKPAIPVGAIELATAVVSAGATATNGAGVTISNTALQTVARGAPTPVRNQAERDVLTAGGAGYDSLTVRRLDVAGRPLEVWDGATWWREMSGDTDWITSTVGFASSAGWTVGSVIYRNRGGVISGMMTITRASGAATLVGPSDGNITDVEVLTAIPANARPGQRLVQLVEGAGPGTAMVYETGRVVLRTLHAGATIAPGTNIVIGMSYLGD